VKRIDRGRIKIEMFIEPASSVVNGVDQDSADPYDIGRLFNPFQRVEWSTASRASSTTPTG